MVVITFHVIVFCSLFGSEYDDNNLREEQSNNNHCSLQPENGRAYDLTYWPQI